MSRRSAFLIVAAFVLAPLGAVAQQGHEGHGAHGAAASDPSANAYMQVHDKMMKDMAVEPTGNADRDFVRMMIPHHQGAVDMAEVQLEYGKDPELRALAQKIIEDQKREIGQMEKWLAENK